MASERLNGIVTILCNPNLVHNGPPGPQPNKQGITNMHLKSRYALAACVALALAVPAIHAATQQKPISRMERAADAIEIQNIMGRYSIYVVANKWLEVGNLFALDEPDVRQNVPREMSGADVRKYFEERNAQKLQPGVMHQHSFLAPLIEVAGDGQTAKGVWDSIGVDTGSGNNMANWGWVRYAIDFKKVKGEWKIWHMKVLSLWNAPYGEAWSQMVQRASNGTMTGGGAVAGTQASSGPAPAAMGAGPAPGGEAGGMAAGAPPAGGMAAATTSATRWRYNGTDDTPVLPANPPKPYYTFDPADAY